MDIFNWYIFLTPCRSIVDQNLYLLGVELKSVQIDEKSELVLHIKQLTYLTLLAGHAALCTESVLEICVPVLDPVGVRGLVCNLPTLWTI